MRVDVTPRQLQVIPGRPAAITVDVTNTRTLISGHRIRVLGVDPQWVEIDNDSLSLFPETADSAKVTVTFPEGIPAGTRTLSIEVAELTPPESVRTVDVQLTVPENLDLSLSLDPLSVTGGKSATVGVLLENSGNAALEADLTGTDEEGEVSFTFTPPAPSLDPGEQMLASVELTAKRHWFGAPVLRPFTVNSGPVSAPVTAFGTWVQKPRVSRGALALCGLLLAATVFGVVLTASLSQVVGQSAADRNLAIQVAQAAQAKATSGTASITGSLTLIGATNQPAAGVTVDLFLATNTTQAIVSTATSSTGQYKFQNLVSGSYKILFDGAGFTELWYPTALTAENATAVNLQAAQQLTGVNAVIGGIPVTISGTVVGGDPSGAVLTLELPTPGASSIAAAPGAVSTALPAASAQAVVATQTLNASGTFTLANVPSPGVYQIVVTKKGYATATQAVNVGGGQNRTDVTIQLVTGDGSIQGRVVATPPGATTAAPLSGAAVSATSGSSTVSTVSLADGSFTLSNLPTPSTLTILVSATNYATQTLSVSLGPDQHLTGIQVTLSSGVGTITGTAYTTGNVPAGGVTVTATNGQLTVTTVTLSVGAVGTYTLSGLPVPDPYSLTFSRQDLASQTLAVTLNSGAVLSGTNATLTSNTASVYGLITDQTHSNYGNALANISILLTSGGTTYQTTTATTPTTVAGQPTNYAIDGITPGTYSVSFTRPGGVTSSAIVTLAPGDVKQFNQALPPAESVMGKVQQVGTNAALPGVQVQLYVATQYPTTPTTATTTDANGNYTFPSVQSSQTFVITFAYPSGTQAQTSVTFSTPADPQAPTIIDPQFLST